MKVYPRLALDISFQNLLVALLSCLLPIDRARITRQIQAFWGIDREVLVTLFICSGALSVDPVEGGDWFSEAIAG
ncbi:hypothetical protein V2H45_00385 [Tumidithrix elongata RA019]|uniref:Uncharacterized protein n=1 Tax=Tumidithrix elongata BACA0141 TaxID=2716417 RepID=A0AAW9PVN6_9CYAN|nr:hypothetical protein [Tumidithrix elongata RA019]